VIRLIGNPQAIPISGKKRQPTIFTRSPGPEGGLVVITEAPPWAWCALAYVGATGVKALSEVLLTRMKLAFARTLLQPPGGRDDPETARKDLDAARKFITLHPGRVPRGVGRSDVGSCWKHQPVGLAVVGERSTRTREHQSVGSCCGQCE
jgi:hypothetical protein